MEQLHIGVYSNIQYILQYTYLCYMNAFRCIYHVTAYLHNYIYCNTVIMVILCYQLDCEANSVQYSAGCQVSLGHMAIDM